MQFHFNRDKVLIVDFGSQVTKLISRRTRELGVFSEIITINELNKIKEFKNVKGIILSGGPSTVTNKKYLRIQKEIFFKEIPILGICYGLQLITKVFGGRIASLKKKREFGRAKIFKRRRSSLLRNFLNLKNNYVWMSHQDAVVKLPKGFKKLLKR